MEKNNNYDIGIDVTEINRFENVSKYFIERILTLNELHQYLKLNSNIEKKKFLASRWAAKEAVYKICANQISHFINIEFYYNDNGKLICKTFPNVKVSISYFDKFVCAIALFL